MNERKNEPQGGARARWRKVLICYLSTAAALAISRVAALVWLEYISMGAHRIDNYLARSFYPESVLSDFIGLTAVRLDGLASTLAFGSIAVLASFAMTTPILLVGWLMLKRR
jgi:hypothetical protein